LDVQHYIGAGALCQDDDNEPDAPVKALAENIFFPLKALNLKRTSLPEDVNYTVSIGAYQDAIASRQLLFT
jgi:hypothetical protein